MANATIYGRTSTGEYIPVAVDSSGNLIMGGGTASNISGSVAISGGTVNVQVIGGTANIAGGTVESKPYSSVLSGELAVGTAAGGTTTGSIPCKLVRWKARASNAGTVFLGGGTTVTTPDGTTDATTGFPLIASDDTGWLPAANVNQFVAISSGTANQLIYMALN